MKSLLTIVLLIGFVGVAVFGFAGVSHGASDAHDSGCIMALAQGADCPTEERAADFLAFHLGTFKSFSTAIFGEPALASLLTLILLAAFIAAAALASDATPSRSVAHFRHRWREFLCAVKQRRLLFWLSLREHSPTFL